VSEDNRSLGGENKRRARLIGLQPFLARPLHSIHGKPDATYLQVNEKEKEKKRAGVEDIKGGEKGEEEEGKEKRCQYSYNCQCTDNLQWLHGVSSSSPSYLLLSLSLSLSST